MISKNRIRQITALRKKKERDENRTYVIEGDKIVREYLKSGIRIKLLAAKPEFISSLRPYERERIDEVEICNYDELKKISTLTTPHNALALVPYPENTPDTGEILSELSVALDFVQDPGNLGTIIRSAAWFGIKNIVCSCNCVDLYNPKVIQATMGAILNVNVHYMSLNDFLKTANDSGLPVCGAILEGRSVYDIKLERRGVILLGNESKGISEELLPYITERISIPKFSDAMYGIESLNVSMAASVIFSEFARRKKLLNETRP